MKIAIKSRKGKITELEINSSDTVKDLKTKIFNLKTTPIDQQHLIFNYSTLKDEKPLKDYLIQDGSTILFIKKKNSLLLPSTKIFDNSSLIDHIHQSNLDLMNNYQKEDVINLMIEAISYLDEELDFNTLNELLSLIVTCFKYNLEESYKIFQIKYNQSNISFSKLLLLSSILSNYSDELKIPEDSYDNFISNSIKEILPQIQNNIDPIKIKGFLVIPQFKTQLINNLILSTKLTEQIVTIFYSFFFLHDTDSMNFNRFIQKVYQEGFIKLIPESVYLKDDYLLQMTIDNLGDISTIITQQKFEEIFPKIEENIIEKVDLNSTFSNKILKKCIQCGMDLKMKTFNILFNYYDDFLSLEVWEYLVKHNYKIDDELAAKIQSLPCFTKDLFPKTPLLLKVFPHPEGLLPEIISYAFLHVDSFDFFFDVQFDVCEVMKTFEFWDHISSIDYTLNDRTLFAMNVLSNYFMINIKVTELNELFDKLIFTNFPPNTKKSNFLTRFLAMLSTDYHNEYFNDLHNQVMIKKLLEQKKIPPPVCCKLFNFQFMDPQEKMTPILCYEQIASAQIENIQNLEILPITNEENLIKFIQQKNDFDIITDFDEQSLSLISATLFFIQNPIQINGLTKENILPFYAIFLENDNCNAVQSTKLMLELLIQSCTYINENPTPLLIESLNSILMKIDFLLNPRNFSSLILYKAVDALCNSLLKGQYKADKTILLLVLFKISCFNPSASIFRKYGVELFQSVVDSLPQIINNKLFDDSFLNLRLFEKYGILRKLVNIIQNSTSYDPIFNIVLFISKYTKNAPVIILDNQYNIETALQKSIYENKWDDVLVIVKFMKENYHKINIQYFNDKKVPLELFKLLNDKAKPNNLDDILSYILYDPGVETNQSIFQSLFNNLLLLSKSISVRYITIFLEKYTVQQVLTPEKIINNLYVFYKLYKPSLIQALEHFYSYSGEKDVFIRKINPGPLKLPEPNFQFLIKLIEHKSYQSFICLHNIASAFPFLFEPIQDEIDSSHSLVAVNIVLPVLNHMSKIFDENLSEENINDIKTSIAALYFLFSCLYSTQFISVFVLWIFENLTKLSDSQVFALSHILVSLFKTDSISKIIFAYAFKYNFNEIISNLLSREISNDLFKYYYKQNLFDLLNSYFRYFSNIRTFGDAIFIEQIKNDMIKQPFQNQFNSFTTIVTTRIKSLSFSIPSEKEPFNSFIKNVGKIQSFMICGENPYKFSSNNTRNYFNPAWKNASMTDPNDEIPVFLYNFKNSPPLFIKDQIPQFPKNITLEMHGVLLNSPNWALNFVENSSSSSNYYYHSYSSENNYKTISKTSEYHDFLITILKKISQFQSKSQNSVLYNNPIDPYDYFSSKISYDLLLSQLLKEALNTTDLSKNNFLIELIIRIIHQNPQFIPVFVQYMSDLISDEKISILSLEKISQIINYVWKNKKENDKLLLEKCGNKLIDFALLSKHQSNGFLLENVAQLLASLKCEIPIRATHLIGMIFAYHPHLIHVAIELYLKIGDNDSANIFPIIKNRYSMDVDKKSPDFGQIRIYIDNFPTLAKSCISTTSILLDKVIARYKADNYHNFELQMMIIELFNMVAPDSHQRQVTSNKSSINIQSEDLLYPVPDYIKETSPIFWENFYEKNRKFLIQMIEKNSSSFNELYFLFNFNELLSFKLRSQHFSKSLIDLINPDDYLCIHVSREKILLDTFGYWCRKQKDDFLGSFNVEFKHEVGSDQGGLTREWFTYLIKEILDPKLGLFIKNAKQSYHLNQSACLNCLNLECLRMAGGIVALSLIRKTNINAHFSRVLLRQLLHQEIQLEDVEEFDESLFNSFRSILDSTDVKPLDLVFSIDELKNGNVTSVNLIENGDKIEVTNENKNEYIRLYINHKLKNSVLEQTKAFCEGFEKFIDYKLIRMFTPDELDLIICGNKTIDIEDMKKYIHYSGNYHDKHPVIVMFFNVLSNWSQENLSKFLLFLTGSSQIGVNGFEAYNDNGDFITIVSSGAKDHLPVAHTCCFQLDLPEYDNEKDMNDKLLLAINETRFGIA